MKHERGCGCGPCEARREGRRAYAREWASRAREREALGRKPRPCDVCGEPYTPRNGRRTCSADCRRLRDGMRASKSAVHRGHLLVRAAKTRAEAKRLAFLLDASDIIRRIEAGCCEVTGIPFFLKHHTEKSTFKHPFAPSLDRIDPAKGYTPDNVQVVVWIYNAAKGQGTHEDVLNLARALWFKERGRAPGGFLVRAKA